MIKVWFLLVLVSMPNYPSIKYNGNIYPNEEECQMAKYEFHETYDSQPTEYKSIVLMEAYCMEFESFPIQGL